MRAKWIVALICMTGVAGCGGGGSSLATGGNGTGTTPSGANVQAVTVDTGPAALLSANTAAVNTLYTNVTVCAPGTSNCQTIDHIQVDTGSTGLRILASALTQSLTQKTDSSGNALAECTRFVDGEAWGTLKTADIKISGEVASNQTVQVIGDPTYPVPNDCSNGDPTTVEDTVGSFGANGILGVGLFLQDCGAACTVAVAPYTYYSCTSTAANGCAGVAMATNMQVLNPVAAFATDNNGVIIQVGAVNGTAASVTGFLIFGIGTQSNNGLGSAKVYTVNSDGSLSTTYQGTTLTQSFIDSGSNALYFPDSTIATCPTNDTVTPGFYCPASTLNLSGTIVGANNTSATINFSVANAHNLFTNNATVAAASTLAAPSTSVNPSSGGSNFSGTNSFDWGLNFYYGRSVVTAIESQNTSAGMGPYFAF